MKTLPLWETSKELKTMYTSMVSQINATVKTLTYHAKHRREWWNRPLTDNQRAWCGIVTGLMLAFFLFACLTLN